MIEAGGAKKPHLTPRIMYVDGARREELPPSGAGTYPKDHVCGWSKENRITNFWGREASDKIQASSHPSAPYG